MEGCEGERCEDLEEEYRSRGTSAPSQEAHCQESSRNTQPGQAQQRGQGLEAELVMWPAGGPLQYLGFINTVLSAVCASWGYCLFYQRGGGKRGRRGRGRERGGKREVKNTLPSQKFTRTERIKVTEMMCVVCHVPLCRWAKVNNKSRRCWCLLIKEWKIDSHPLRLDNAFSSLLISQIN